MNIRRLTFILLSFVFSIGITFFTFQTIVKRDSTVNQPSLITMTDLGYENSETTNAIVREFHQSGYSGKMYSLKISTQTNEGTISLDIDLLKCDDEKTEEFYRSFLIDVYHSEREMKACGAKDNCHIPKLDYEKTVSQLVEMDCTALGCDLAYALHDPLTFAEEQQNNELYILKDSLVLYVEPWGMNQSLTQSQLDALMTLFDQAYIVFEQ